MEDFDELVTERLIPIESHNQNWEGIHTKTENDGKVHKHPSSWRIIFSIWNTMIGSTLVTLPYAFSTSGILLGVGLVFLIGVLCCYTCNLVIQYGMNFQDYGAFIDYYLGRSFKVLAVMFSLFVLCGACIAYHILMQECILHVIAASAEYILSAEDLSRFLHYWTPQNAAFVIILLYPLMNLKTMSILVRFNSFGVFFVIYLVAFIAYQGVTRLADGSIDSGSIHWIAAPSFGVLGGIVTLSFFIHNAIQPLIESAEPRSRQGIVQKAYLLVGVSYTCVGVFGYLGFPDQGNLQQNFFDSFPTNDIFVFTARFSLFLQLSTVYPLVTAIVRSQLFDLLCGKSWPGLMHAALLNAAIIATTTAFAVFYPHVGDVLRFVGAIGGLFLIFFFPLTIHLMQLSKRRNKYNLLVVTGNLSCLVFGFLLVILQFV